MKFLRWPYLILKKHYWNVCVNSSLLSTLFMHISNKWINSKKVFFSSWQNWNYIYLCGVGKCARKSTQKSKCWCKSQVYSSLLRQFSKTCSMGSKKQKELARTAFVTEPSSCLLKVADQRGRYRNTVLKKMSI